jgi:hypothetical protein
MTREPIMQALFTLLSGIPGVVTASRIMKPFSQIADGDQPALFLLPRTQAATRTRGLPTKWDIDVSVVLFAKRNGEDVVPDTLVNNILDAIELALAPKGGVEVQTLGGLCDHCWIQGAIETDEGTLGNQSVAIVPIHILVSF